MGGVVGSCFGRVLPPGCVAKGCLTPLALKVASDSQEAVHVE